MHNQCQSYLIYSHYCRLQIKISKKLRKTRFFYNLNILMKKGHGKHLKDKSRQNKTGDDNAKENKTDGRREKAGWNPQ
jgi:hypothetical protein